MVSTVKARQAIESLYEGTCSVHVRAKSVDPDTKETMFTETLLFGDLPCRLSFSAIAATDTLDHAPKIGQSVKLFISPDVEIPPGSRIDVNQNGRDSQYSQSGVPALYATHQEIPLELWDGWA